MHWSVFLFPTLWLFLHWDISFLLRLFSSIYVSILLCLLLKVAT